MSFFYSNGIDLLTVDELSKRTGKAKQTFHNWRHMGLGQEYLKISRSVTRTSNGKCKMTLQINAEQINQTLKTTSIS